MIKPKPLVMKVSVPRNVITTSMTSSSSSSSTSDTPSPNGRIIERIQQYNKRHVTDGRTQSCQEQENVELIQAMANQAYHLPGYESWYDDLLQYVCNNHPLLSICCHHKLHPVKFWMRLWSLMSSILFGLCLTNCMWLWYYYYNPNQNNNNDPLFVVGMKNDWDNDNSSSNSSNNDYYNVTNNGTDSSNTTTTASTSSPILGMEETTAQHSYDEIRITQGMLVLWTLGGVIHALFDSTIWYLETCICCLPRYHPSSHKKNANVRYRKQHQCYTMSRCIGRYLIITITIACAAIASLVVVLRASYNHNANQQMTSHNTTTTTMTTNATDILESEDSTSSSGLYNNISSLLDPNRLFYEGNNSNNNNTNNNITIQKASEYNFLLSYGVEMIVALVIYYPIIVTILFSGYLGCGSIPILGGRPYEIKQELKQQQQKAQQGQQNEQRPRKQ